MKLRRKSKARDTKLKGEELDELAQEAADEASNLSPVSALHSSRYGAVASRVAHQQSCHSKNADVYCLEYGERPFLLPAESQSAHPVAS